MFNLTVNFNDIDSLNNFVKILMKSGRKPIKNTKRGEKIRELHKQAKEYKREHPELDYKECLKIIKIN